MMRKAITDKERQTYSLIFNIDSYKSFLLDDFSKNKGFADLASALSFLEPATIVKWVGGIEGNDFMDSMQTGSFMSEMLSGMEIVKNINYTPYYFTENREDLYAFFGRRIYDTYEEAVRHFPYEYYICEENMYGTINKKILPHIGEGYQAVKGGKSFIKKIGGFAQIKLSPKYKDIYGTFSGIDGYRFPNISVDVNGMEFRPIYDEGSGIGPFLFLTGRGLNLFYRESHIIEYDGHTGAIIKVVPKEDEPVIYEYNKQYIISNSVEKLAYYNKYIYMVLELYCHYFKVFEKWLMLRLEEIKDEL